MRDWTFAQVASKVKQDLDMVNEDFVTDAELYSYIDEAIDDAEAEIHKLGLEDQYFLDSAYLTLVSGTADYALPATIYANKILGIIHNDGTRRYTIKRLRAQRGASVYSQMAEIEATGLADDYQYLITNSATAAVGRRIHLVPTARTTSSTLIRVWFIRNAIRYTASSDVIDIPEFANFLLSYAKVRCMAKEGGNPMLELEIAALQKQRTLMIETLTEMVPDGDNEIEADFSHYEDMT